MTAKGRRDYGAFTPRTNSRLHKLPGFKLLQPSARGIREHQLSNQLIFADSVDYVGGGRGNHAYRSAKNRYCVGLAAFAAREHPPKSAEVIAERFTFLGRDCRITTDYSSIWDSRSSVHSGDSSAIELLYAVQRFLEKLDSMPDAGSQIDELLGIIAQGAQHAVVWRRLMNSGSKHPKALGYGQAAMDSDGAAVVGAAAVSGAAGVLACLGRMPKNCSASAALFSSR